MLLEFYREICQGGRRRRLLYRLTRRMIPIPTLDPFASGGKEHSNGSETVT